MVSTQAVLTWKPNLRQEPTTQVTTLDKDLPYRVWSMPKTVLPWKLHLPRDEAMLCREIA